MASLNHEFPTYTIVINGEGTQAHKMAVLNAAVTQMGFDGTDINPYDYDTLVETWWRDTELPTEEEMIALGTQQLQAVADKQYQYARALAYPSIGDQLDALFHAGVFPEEMAAQIQAVKDANPKPE